MKKYLILFVFLIVACSDNSTQPVTDENTLIRLKAWNHIDSETQKTVITQWNRAKIEIGEHWQSKQKCYMITFHTNMDLLIGPIVVNLDYHTKEFIGFNPRK